ncbi:hypothetical protein GCM10010273_16350 [Streptomyces lavendulocolor]
MTFPPWPIFGAPFRCGVITVLVAVCRCPAVRRSHGPVGGPWRPVGGGDGQCPAFMPATAAPRFPAGEAPLTRTADGGAHVRIL